MNFRICDLDSSFFINSTTVSWAVQAIDSFCKDVSDDDLKSAGLVASSALAYFARDVYDSTGNTKEYSFDKECIKAENRGRINGTGNINTFSSWCRITGLLYDQKGLFGLSELASFLLKPNKINIGEFAFFILTKQWVRINEECYQPLLSVIGKLTEDEPSFLSLLRAYTQNNKAIQKSLQDLFFKSVTGRDRARTDAISFTRFDTLRNCMVQAGMLTDKDSGFILTPQGKQILTDFRCHESRIKSFKKRDTDFYDYMCSIDNGAISLIGKDNISIYQSIYPNLSRLALNYQSTDACPTRFYLPIAPYQQIFFGPPGTGKSFEIKKLTQDKSVIRTTFHPDSDYSSFVGCYKPTMENGSDANKEKRISYKFVIQAFLKAYLEAWKKYSALNQKQASTAPLSATVGDAKYTVTKVSINDVTYDKQSPAPSKRRVQTVWNQAWKDGAFKIEKGPQSGTSVEQAICLWIKDKLPKCTQDSFDEGWTAFLSELDNGPISYGKSIGTDTKGQTYTFSKSGSGITFLSSARSSKDTLRNRYPAPAKNDDAAEKAMIEILNLYQSNTFDEAWDRLMQDTLNSSSPAPTGNSVEPQYLIIEELNRGNCAQIFGDLFQLLDRGDNGFSEYPIEADSDLQREIERAFNSDDDNNAYKLFNDLHIDDVVDGYSSNYGATLSEDIQKGKVLLLPPNLYIWATMNTSDQSLFPIDSAFKRRWDWTYFPIKNEGKGVVIALENGNKYDWWNTISKLNKKIYDVTKSADKQLGYWFVRVPKGGSIINGSVFVSKVVFYLWNDVFKDYSLGEKNAFSEDVKFEMFYNGDGSINEDIIVKFMDKNGIDPVPDTDLDSKGDVSPGSDSIAPMGTDTTSDTDGDVTAS